MTTRADFLKFLYDFNYEEQSVSDVMGIYDKIMHNSEAKEIFDSYIEPYKSRGELDFLDFCQRALPEITNKTGLHPFEVNLLCYPFAPYAEPFYERAGVEYKVYRDSMQDFKCKLDESRLTVGFPCCMPNTWFRAWFFAERFCFTRLQFEYRKAQESYKSERFDVREGDTFITIHIPSMRNVSFSKENRWKSYREAREYYSNKFDRPFVIGCASWLLAELHSEILPESSNIRGFAEEFERYKFVPHRNDLWRIFNIENSKLPPDEDLPENTDLQRRYKKFLLSGGMPGTSTGYLIED